MARLRRQWGIQTRAHTRPGWAVEWRPPQWGWSEADARAYIERRNAATPGGGRVVYRVLSEPIVVVGPPAPQPLVYVDRETHEPCPTAGNALCTLAHTDANHRHVARHMLAEG